MAYTREQKAAIQIMNDLKDDLVELANEVVDALQDGKVSAFEGILLGQQAMSMGMKWYSTFSDIPADMADGFLDALEDMDFTLPVEEDVSDPWA